MSSGTYDDGDVTPGGSTIIVDSGDRGPVDATPTPFIEEIEAHLEPFFGKPESVLHEVFSSSIHLDVMVFPPKGKRSHWLFVTAGMSDLPMTLPAEVEASEFARAELVIGLPPEWGARAVGDDPDDASWSPIRLLKWLARYPHDAGTYFAAGHTIPMEFSGAEIEGRVAPFTTALLLAPRGWPEAARTATLLNGQRLNFYGVYPLYEDETDMKLNDGSEAVVRAMIKRKVTEVLDARRPSFRPRRGIMGVL